MGVIGAPSVILPVTLRRTSTILADTTAHRAGKNGIGSMFKSSRGDVAGQRKIVYRNECLTLCISLLHADVPDETTENGGR